MKTRTSQWLWIGSLLALTTGCVDDETNTPLWTPVAGWSDAGQTVIPLDGSTLANGPDSSAQIDGGTFGGQQDAAVGGSFDAAADGQTGSQTLDGGADGTDAGGGSPLDASTQVDAAVGGGTPGVRIEGGVLLVDGQAFHIQGACWNPVGKGGTHPNNIDFPGFVAQDSQLMRAAGLNAVRTYETITDTAVLDTLHAAGIRVLNMLYAWGGADASVVDDKVRAVKDHPAILMWVLGNEWNYNGLYVGMSHQASLDRINEAAARIRAIDDTHPIATVYGEIPSSATVDAMPLIDIWGINAYRGLSFGSLFDQFAQVSNKPMFLAEYGADAWDATQGAVNLAAQAQATRALTQEILDHSAARTANGQCLGGTIFEWADEWWKDGAGSPSVQDVGGIAPGGGPYPDQTFNEEWWGVVDIDRNPRPAYDELKALFAP